ncbi:hypothetical protein CLAIMM_10436 isoform 2, partial [Cladophialophora immunda]
PWTTSARQVRGRVNAVYFFDLTLLSLLVQPPYPTLPPISTHNHHLPNRQPLLTRQPSQVPLMEFRISSKSAMPARKFNRRRHPGYSSTGNKRTADAMDSDENAQEGRTAKLVEVVADGDVLFEVGSGKHALDIKVLGQSSASPRRCFRACCHRRSSKEEPKSFAYQRMSQKSS